MVNEGAACAGLVGCLWAFQTLIAGVFAVLVGGGTAYVLLHTARLPVKAHERELEEGRRLRVRLRCLELSEEYRTLQKRAVHGASTVKAHKASNTGVTEEVIQRMMFCIPTSTQDWQFMSTIPEELARKCISLNAMLDEHNFDMERTGGAFGDDNYGRSVSDRLKKIAQEAGYIGGIFSNTEAAVSKSDASLCIMPTKPS